MKPATTKRLRDALQAARLIERNTLRITRSVYESDPWTRAAVERQLEIIGEAFNNVRRLEPEPDAAFPALHEWISMRNFIAHRYDAVDNEIVWDTIRVEIPILITRLEKLLADE